MNRKAHNGGGYVQRVSEYRRKREGYVSPSAREAHFSAGTVVALAVLLLAVLLAAVATLAL